MAQTAEQFWNDIPKITKYLLIFILSLTLGAQFGLIDPYTYMLDFDMIFSRHLELWRFITNMFFFGGFGFPFVINLLLLLQYSGKLEKDTLNGRTADFVFMLIFGAIPMTIAAYFLRIPFLSMSLMSYLIYIWCNNNTGANLSLFFIPIQIPARYFPWALLLFHMLMGGSLIYDLIGIIAGHIYYFVVFYYPREYGQTLINTPKFLQQIFPPQQLNVSGFALNQNRTVQQQQQQAQQPQQQQAQQGGIHRWGTGRRLGAN